MPSTLRRVHRNTLKRTAHPKSFFFGPFYYCTSLRLHTISCSHNCFFPRQPIEYMQYIANAVVSRGLPRFIKGIYWAASLFLRTPFTEGCAGVNKKASPPGRQLRCTLSPTTFSSVQFTLLGIIFFLRSLYSKFSSVYFLCTYLRRAI